MRIVDLDFVLKKFSKFKHEVWDKSLELINEIIAESPIQKGEIVDVVNYNPTFHPEYKANKTIIKMKLTTIHLMIQGKYSPSNNCLSYKYYGIPVKKDGITPMRNRKEIEIDAFVKDGIEYHVPSYWRLRVVPAAMYEFICGKCNRR